MVAYISLIVCFLGGAFYIAAHHPDIKELGRLAFFAGLFTFLLQIGGHTIGLFK